MFGIRNFFENALPDLKEWEGEFQEFYLHSIMSMQLVAGTIMLIANMAMIYMDVGFSEGNSGQFLFSVFIRILFSLFTLSAIIVARWNPSSARMETIVSVWVFIASLYYLLFNYLRPASHLTTSVDIIFIFSVYVFFGYRLKWLMPTMILFSATSIALTLFLKSDVPLVVRVMTAAVHVLVQGIGLLAALQAQSFRRKTFLAYIKEKEASELSARLLQTDPLTGCFSRRHFFELAEGELDRAKRYGRPFCVIMMDLDRFKSVNDRYGHLMGDYVLTAFSALVNEQKRRSDILGRLGGEEFALLLPETDLATAQKVASRIQDAWARTDIFMSGLVINSTVSIGTAELEQEGSQSFEELLHYADLLMYEKKGERQTAVR